MTSRLFRLLPLLWFCSIIEQDSQAQPVFPPATQTEVDAGVLTSKFVSPATLHNYTGGSSPTSGVSAATVTNISRYFASNTVFIVNGTNILVVQTYGGDKTTNTINWITPTTPSPTWGFMYNSNGVQRSAMGLIFTNGQTVIIRTNAVYNPSSGTLGTVMVPSDVAGTMVWTNSLKIETLNVAGPASVGYLYITNYLTMPDGAADGYVMTSSAGGIGTWQPPTGGSGTLISNANILWVDRGATLSGLRGHLDRPFPHPKHAWSNAVAGDTIIVLPGNYHGCSNMMKAGVNWQGIGWPLLTYTNVLNDTGCGIFDERFSGSTTSVIHGFNFIYSSGLPGTNADGTACCTPTNISFAGVLSITNRASKVDFEFGDVDFMTIPIIGGCQVFNVQDTTLTRIKGRSIRDIFYSSNYFVGLDDGGGSVYKASSAEGLYWEQGETYFDVDNVLMSKYSIYAKCPVSGLNRTNNLWVNIANSVGDYYSQTDCTNPPNWRTWNTIKNFAGSTNIESFGTAVGIALQVLGGGKHYFNCQKISSGLHDAPAITISGGGAGKSIPRVWITAQKIAFEKGTADLTPTALLCSVADGIVDFDVMEWEDTGGAVAGLVLNSGTTTVHGGRMTLTNGVGVTLGIGATARLIGLTIDTSTTSAMTNTPIFVSTNGLILQNCTLVAPTAAPSLMAVASRSVLSYNSIIANKTNHPNVSVLAGPFTVDSNVR